MKKKVLLVLAGLLLVGCTSKNIKPISNSSTSNSTTDNNDDKNTSSNTDDDNNTSSNTGDNGNTNNGDDTNQGGGNQGNTGDNNQGNDNQGGGGNTNTGDNDEKDIVYTDVTINDTFVAPGFSEDAKFREDNMDDGEYGDLVGLNDAIRKDFNCIGKHYYEGAFTNKLPNPKETVSNLDELTYVLEYCGFYGIESYNVKFDPTYTFESAEKELNKAYWSSRMLSQVAGYYYENGANSSYNLNFIYNELAATAICKEVPSISAVNPYKITSTEGNLITKIPYTPTKGDLDVHNSDQLIYAIENGYKPKMVKDSRVDLLYRKACYLLTHTITDNMNDLQKIYVVSDTIFNIADYDTPADDIACGIRTDSVLEARFPASLASTFASFFAEGPLLYGGGTCAGFAKAQALLFALLNIKHLRVTGGNVIFEDTIYSKNPVDGYWYHEYNYYIDSNDKYYVCDITYSCVGTFADIDGKSYRFPMRPICVAFTRQRWGRTYDPNGIFNDMIKLYKNSSLGTEDLRYYDQIMIYGNTSMFANNANTFEAGFTAAKQAINDYKIKNNITKQQLYLLSFDSNTVYEDYLTYSDGAEYAVSQQEGQVAYWFYHYAYGANFFMYM